MRAIIPLLSFRAIRSQSSSPLLSTAFAASVWINDKFISTVHNGADHISAQFPFPAGAVLTGKDNVITVLQDNMGNDEDANEKSARGISAFQLNGGTISQWKVQGKVGGYTK